MWWCTQTAVFGFDPGYGSLGHYGSHKGEPECPPEFIGLILAAKMNSVMDESLEKPNGLAFSPDYTHPVLSDTGASHEQGHPAKSWIRGAGGSIPQRRICFVIWVMRCPTVFE